MTVKVLDAGNRLMLSSEHLEEVVAELDARIKAGAKRFGDPYRLGSSWVAACGVTPKALGPDDTSTLQLSDFNVDGGKTDGSDSDDPELADGCRVEELGFKRIVTGPSKQAVQLRITHMKRYGAELVGEIEEQDGEWVAVVETGGADKVFRF